MSLNNFFNPCVISVLFIVAVFEATTAITWENVEPGVRRSNHCDFPGTELIRTIRGTNLTVCENECQFSTGCTHFVWNQNGTCWIKTGAVSDKTANAIHDSNTFCGHLIILWKFPTPLDDNAWSFNCDFPSDRDFKNEKSKGEDCGELCRTTPPCSHFTWTNRQPEGGICRMKYGDISREDAILAPGSLGIGSTCGFQKEKKKPTAVTLVNSLDCQCDCSKFII